METCERGRKFWREIQRKFLLETSFTRTGHLTPKSLSPSVHFIILAGGTCGRCQITYSSASGGRNKVKVVGTKGIILGVALFILLVSSSSSSPGTRGQSIPYIVRPTDLHLTMRGQVRSECICSPASRFLKVIGLDLPNFTHKSQLCGFSLSPRIRSTAACAFT